jgi:ribonuclease P protein component
VFPARKRLSRNDFPAALAAGRRVASPHFKAVISAKTTGYAVVIPKKVARLSVTRHRIKRQVLSALRSFPELPPSLILFPQSSVALMNYRDIETELAGILSKIRE